MNDFTVDDIVEVLASAIEPFCGVTYQGQKNRSPMPKGEFCILTPLNFRKLSTTREIKHDTGDPATSSMAYTDVRQLDVQVDIYGKASGDRATTLEALFNSDYGYSRIKGIDERLAPLYASEPRKMPMVNGEQQWQDRYTLTLSVQAHITISLPQDYFDRAEFTLSQVDNRE